MEFDHVVLACHGDQALALQDDPAPKVKTLLSAFKYERNLAILHSDPALMPKNQKETKVQHVTVNMSEDGNIRRLMQPTLDKESEEMQGAKFVRVIVHAFAE